MFNRPKSGGPFYKFPPIIGARGQADLLFIGINPRLSNTNLDLHNWLMASSEAFVKLANNKLKNGDLYIALNGKEEHYHCHMMIVEGVFGIGTAFEERAAVAELMYCASQNEPAILSHEKSPCADLYLHRVLKIVNPKVLVAVGSGVKRHLQIHFKDMDCESARRCRCHLLCAQFNCETKFWQKRLTHFGLWTLDFRL